MRIESHIRHSLELFGYSGEDIHRWMDAFFDIARYRVCLRSRGRLPFNPYGHRCRRHFREALPEALEQFDGKYPAEIIEKIFFQHLMDDYGGYIPLKKDFSNKDFLEHHHPPAGREGGPG